MDGGAVELFVFFYSLPEAGSRPGPLPGCCCPSAASVVDSAGAGVLGLPAGLTVVRGAVFQALVVLVLLGFRVFAAELAELPDHLLVSAYAHPDCQAAAREHQKLCECLFLCLLSGSVASFLEGVGDRA